MSQPGPTPRTDSRQLGATHTWSPVPDWDEAKIVRHGWSARRVLGLGLLLITGDLDRARKTYAPQGDSLGLWSIADTFPYTVRLGRDRALIVAERALPVLPGWNLEGWAVTVQNDGYAVFELRGASVREIISEAVAADLESGSPSAATLFAGQSCALHRVANDAARLYVERPFAPFIWRWLETR